LNSNTKVNLSLLSKNREALLAGFEGRNVRRLCGAEQIAGD
jgi:hypothetical protein